MMRTAYLHRRWRRCGSGAGDAGARDGDAAGEGAALIVFLVPVERPVESIHHRSVVG